MTSVSPAVQAEQDQRVEIQRRLDLFPEMLKALAVARVMLSGYGIVRPEIESVLIRAGVRVGTPTDRNYRGDVTESQS